MLLFRAGGAAPKAVPLGLVARLEDIPRDTDRDLLRRAGDPVSRQADAAGPLVAARSTRTDAAARAGVRR